jgi:hypothetical protein
MVERMRTEAHIGQGHTKPPRAVADKLGFSYPSSGKLHTRSSRSRKEE